MRFVIAIILLCSCSRNLGKDKYKPRGNIFIVHQLEDPSAMQDIMYSGVNVSPIYNNSDNDIGLQLQRNSINTNLISSLSNHIFVSRNPSRYTFYYQYYIGDGQNIDIDIFFPLQSREQSFMGGNFGVPSTGWGQTADMFGMNMLGYEDVDIPRLNVWGAGHSHMIKGTVVKRVYQKNLEVSIYDTQTKLVVYYAKIESFGECPFMNKDILRTFAAQIFNPNFPNISESSKTFDSQEGNCKNAIFSRSSRPFK